ncbi:ChbG/HpnK family deacetylase [Aquihabitans daechungensis]|uniref:ChbG/HpnK family deacetylase n=1 Tax=Aquihabitans daechungensis TaxID=1052257 RepID=UPI003B9E63FD
MAIRRLAARFRRACRRAGVATTDQFAGLDEAGGWDTEQLDRVLQASGTSLELNLHPGATDDPDRARFAWGYEWGGELELLCAPATREAVRRSGWDLATPGEVAAST